ncbi:hypothetical protein THTE_4235 [Thermogutta terrifontis]|uniref:Uncharacterized protein n=1 Tax=Thermogutta terrifontis TaxID=1331910 RepID=A0A286RLK3_9BACT|nr:hypothetical protein THTE_4235 [Thermogutta terrifontis]
MCPPVGAIHELPLQRRRDPLVGPVFSEARACHVRSTRIDDPSLPLPRAGRACPSKKSAKHRAPPKAPNSSRGNS